MEGNMLVDIVKTKKMALVFINGLMAEDSRDNGEKEKEMDQEK